jgi:hypothetical protein
MYLHGSRGVRRNFTEGARKAFRFPSFVTERSLTLPLFEPTISVFSALTQPFFPAAKWYRVASEMGDISGMVSFGTMALKGLGMPANSTEALRLFQKVCARSRLRVRM